MMKTLKQYGQGMTEYLIIIAAVAIAAIAAYQLFGSTVRSGVADTASELSANGTGKTGAGANGGTADGGGSGAGGGGSGSGGGAGGGSGGGASTGATNSAGTGGGGAAIAGIGGVGTINEGGGSGGGAASSNLAHGGGGGATDSKSAVAQARAMSGDGANEDADVEIKNIGTYKAGDEESSNVLLYIILGIVALIAIFMMMRDSDKGKTDFSNPYTGLGRPSGSQNDEMGQGMSAGGASGGSSGVGSVSRGGLTGAGRSADVGNTGGKSWQPPAEGQRSKSDYDDDYPG